MWQDEVKVKHAKMPVELDSSKWESGRRKGPTGAHVGVGCYALSFYLIIIKIL